MFNTLKVFTVYDTKAGYFKNPFIMKSTGEALRAFSDVAQDEKTEIGKHPEDFCLFEIAEFDEIKGQYEQKTHVSLGRASDFIIKQ